MKSFICAVSAFLTVTAACANVADINQFKQTHIRVINQTGYDELLSFRYTHGHWKKPLVDEQVIPLAPGQSYENTLISNHFGKKYKSFASLSVYRQEKPRDNYVIFAQTMDSSERDPVLADIYDGLGNMFVSSWTNQCLAKAADGFTDCELVIKDNS